MAPVTKESVLETLRRIVDPDGGGGDVVSRGVISGVVIRDGNVGFAIEVDPAEGGAKEPLRQACERAVLALPGVTSVTAVLTAERTPGGGGAAAAAPPRSPVAG
ncbi:MAG TPA: iron-sulfur cluster assembly protein, partial [Geminicoccaceae bacterium]|nr:iron-sulfur cluster assembly protein [Geminicoccaceae bacterium]